MPVGLPWVQPRSFCLRHGEPFLGFVSRGSAEDFGLGSGWIRVVVQAAGSRSIQVAARRTGSTIGGVTCERVGDDSGRDRCFEVEASAALPTGDKEPRIKVAEKKIKKEKKKRTAQSIAICVTKLVEARLNERANQRNFLEQLTRRQAGVAGDVARSVA